MWSAYLGRREQGSRQFRSQLPDLSSGKTGLEPKPLHAVLQVHFFFFLNCSLCQTHQSCNPSNTMSWACSLLCSFQHCYPLWCESTCVCMCIRVCDFIHLWLEVERTVMGCHQDNYSSLPAPVSFTFICCHCHYCLF